MKVDRRISIAQGMLLLGRQLDVGAVHLPNPYAEGDMIRQTTDHQRFDRATKFHIGYNVWCAEIDDGQLTSRISCNIETVDRMEITLRMKYDDIRREYVLLLDPKDQGEFDLPLTVDDLSLSRTSAESTSDALAVLSFAGERVVDLLDASTGVSILPHYIAQSIDALRATTELLAHAAA